MNEVKLTLAERIILPSIFPEKGSFDKLVIRDDINEKIKITQEEIAKYKIQATEDGKISFDLGEDVNEFEYNFTELEAQEIKNNLKSLSEKDELHREFKNIYKMFVA